MTNTPIRVLAVLAAVAVSPLALAGGPAPATPASPAPVAPATASPAGAPRHPLAERAEARFFEVFNDAPATPEAALRDLMLAYVVDPEDARTNLLLGLNHLWLAAEGNRRDPRVVEHLYLARTFLERARARAPEDARMPSWLVPAGAALATIEQDPARAAALGASLVEAYGTDPAFHAFVVGMQAFHDDPASASFRFALEAMRAAVGCVGGDDPTCGNRPRWPHNLEAFSVFAADFELKAGERRRARALLEAAARLPDFASWPYQRELEERLATLDARADRYANDDPDDDPPSLFTGTNEIACQACHRAR